MVGLLIQLRLAPRAIGIGCWQKSLSVVIEETLSNSISAIPIYYYNQRNSLKLWSYSQFARKFWPYFMCYKIHPHLTFKKIPKIVEVFLEGGKVVYCLICLVLVACMWMPDTLCACSTNTLMLVRWMHVCSYAHLHATLNQLFFKSSNRHISYVWIKYNTKLKKILENEHPKTI